MNTWFTVKVKYTKQLDNGQLKRVSEPYLVAAVTFTDAEARIFQVLGESIRGEFVVTNIAKTDYADIFHFDECEIWYKLKITYVSMDADNDKAKKIANNFLVSANDLKDACVKLDTGLDGTLMDYDIVAVSVSPIIDIFPYDENAEPAYRDEVVEDVKVKVSGKKVFTASGSDADDDIDEIENHEFADEEGDIEDEFDEKA